MKVLFLTTVLPRRKRMGSEVASQAVIDALDELGAQVTVVGYVRAGDQYSLGAGEICAGKRHVETKDAGSQAAVWFLLSLVKGLPYSVGKYWSSAFASRVRKLTHLERFDVVIVDHVQMGWLIKAVPLKGKLVGMAHNVEHQMYTTFINERTSRLHRWVYERESRLLQQLETTFVNRVDQLWALTKDDVDSFAELNKNGSIMEFSLPGCAAPSDEVITAKEFDIGLVGSWTWKANEAGLKWFFEDVYPHISSARAIHVAGNGATWLEGRYANVTHRGFVHDVHQFLRSARVIAIPTLSGGGIQIKTLDAIASGSTIVATPLALRGIEPHPPTVSVAENAKQFAALLDSALSVSSREDLAIDAIEWSRRRHRQFQNEIMQSIRTLIEQ